MPPGYCIVVDYATDSIIVANGSEDEVRDSMKSGTGKLADGTALWGFALTRASIDDNLHIETAKAAFARLVEVVSRTTECVKTC